VRLPDFAGTTTFRWTLVTPAVPRKAALPGDIRDTKVSVVALRLGRRRAALL
jgi:hypothetical protein